MSDFPRLSHAGRKVVRSLQLRRGRDEAQQFLAEGRKLCAELLASAYSPGFIVVSDAAGSEELMLAGEFAARGTPAYSLGGRDFDGIADARTPQGILATVQYPQDRSISSARRLVVLDGVADPGNVGTIIRTADWFGFRDIILGEGCADRFSPKVVRATMGSVFRCNVIETGNLAAGLAELHSTFRLYGAALAGAKQLGECCPDGAFGVVFGGEARGISPETTRLLGESFVIPGGGAESLNVAVAAGIALYHFAVR